MSKKCANVQPQLTMSLTCLPWGMVFTNIIIYDVDGWTLSGDVKRKDVNVEFPELYLN